MTWVCFSSNLCSQVTNYNFSQQKLPMYQLFKNHHADLKDKRRAMFQVSCEVPRDAGQALI